MNDPRTGRAIDLVALAREGTVHFVGIGGAGMSALAELLVRSGGRVSGCDREVGESTRALRSLGVTVRKGHDPDHVADTVAVVTTAAVPSDHPELVAARRRAIPVLKRAGALGGVVNAGRVVGVAGTHGKTTTTAMTTAILAEAGLEPTGFVGGVVPGWGGGLRMGSGDLFVVEADEYDRSFMALRPEVVVVTTIEADHLDVYGSEEAVRESFREFAALLPADGLLAACSDDDGARALLERAASRTETLAYGTGRGAALRAVDIEARGLGTRFRVAEGAEVIGELAVAVPGLHNVRNALGAVAAARRFGAGIDAARRALSAFHGVSRRFQVLGTVDGVTVVDDYAHHPTEIEATLAAARNAYPGRRIVAVFQPHLYTRSRDFAERFGRALSAADRVWVTDVYAAREEPIPGVSGELIVRHAERAGARDVRYHPSLEGLAAELASELRSGDVCLTLGAGDIDRVARALLERRPGAGEADRV